MSNQHLPATPPQPIYLRDYTPPPYHIPKVELHFELGATATTVRSLLHIVRAAHTAPGTPLVLDGKDLELLRVHGDGVELDRAQYQVDAQSLTIFNPPPQLQLEVVTRIRPQDNTALEGLYQSNGNFCTQCEAQGFRRITYFLDRPDVMALFTVRIVADKQRYPLLLANGNLLESGDLDHGQHYALWHDPFPKPSYLFALVAADLCCMADTFTTKSGRTVALRIYVEEQHVEQCAHAMSALKQAMAWDEQRFGLEYDLDLYMIVAVSDFNMGAMENKGLNIFNTKYVLASRATATDNDYQGILNVIGHEYFHNWTGNRITCRDWFQLSLKEGLTVFRDQEFSSDLGSRGVKRIEDVRILRGAQFPQDAGPMAHAVRPDSYIEINNFYTVTVYNKGAEVIRMLHTLLGEDGFQRGMRLYVQRHDGQAVTCDDFVAAMADANQVDLQQFKLWYSQAGTPQLTVSDHYDASTCTYTLHLEQTCPPTPGQPNKLPFHMPIALGLIGADGQDLTLQLAGETGGQAGTRVLELRAAQASFHFINVPQRPVLSLLRGFSAPLKLETRQSAADLRFRIAHDSDPFNRWDAAQTLALRTILQLLEGAPATWELEEAFCNAFAHALGSDLDCALLAHMLSLPSEIWVAEHVAVIDVEGIHHARRFVQRTLAQHLRPLLLERYHALAAANYELDAAAIGRRALRNVCLDYLLHLEDAQFPQLALQQFHHADNMTDQLAALSALNHRAGAERETALDAFYQRWQQEPLVVDKWLSLQASCALPNTLHTVQSLLHHPAFNLRNPNKVRALLGAFCHANPLHFHAGDGSGYRFLTAKVLELNAFNPQIAARLVAAFTTWRRYDAARQALLRQQLEQIRATPHLCPDVYEIVAKSLEAAPAQ